MTEITSTTQEPNLILVADDERLLHPALKRTFERGAPGKTVEITDSATALKIMAITNGRRLWAVISDVDMAATAGHDATIIYGQQALTAMREMGLNVPMFLHTGGVPTHAVKPIQNMLTQNTISGILEKPGSLSIFPSLLQAMQNDPNLYQLFKLGYGSPEEKAASLKRFADEAKEELPQEFYPKKR